MNSFGVAAGKAMMIARHKLCRDPSAADVFKSNDSCSQNVQNDVKSLKTGDDFGSQGGHQTVAYQQSGVHPTAKRLAFSAGSHKGKDTRMGLYNICPVVGTKVIFDPMLTAAISCTAQPQSTEATLARFPIVLESGNKHTKQMGTSKRRRRTCDPNWIIEH
ncbi:hypothetical protein PHLCEN_2v2286 [Hermanssonia centrifuga]|uniref:Uncharacterized protein n=1 Tax=Hermanssonia centrifuga TaxID=98765 RepID=A0A2R6RPP4_9APHY|nr:hypothetical protein PHLCEN_2v2286 [Hermanssonia centrifuga]